MAVVKFKDGLGVWHSVPAIQGEQGIQGIQGITGNGIASVTLTSGDHSPGTTDTYTITYTDDTTTTFTVYNGQDYRFDVPMNWLEFQACVRDGTITNYFTVGDQFNVTKGATNLVFDIVDIGSSTRNVTANGNAPTDPNYFTQFPNAKPVTLLLSSCIPSVVFGQFEANYKITTQIPSGATRNISLETYVIAANTYNFTAPSNLVVGGKLRLRYDNPNYFLDYYVAPFTTATAIPLTPGPADATYTDCSASLSAQNDKLRVDYGSGNYINSAARQWLNTAAANGYWVSKTDYDLAPPWHTTLAGFKNGLDANFLAVVGKTTREVELNTTTDGGGNGTISDDFFYASLKEITNSSASGTHNGVVFQYYADNVQANRIKYSNVTPFYVYRWMVRSVSAPLTTTYAIGHISATGTVAGNYATDAVMGSAVACVIL